MRRAVKNSFAQDILQSIYSKVSSKQNFYITTPIYYVNDAPHIGHAYTSLACDVLARFKRLEGYDVHFLTGTDEHGQKVEKSALKKGKTPQEFCDEISVKFKDLTEFLGISNDDFIRTTEDRHKQVAQNFWQILQDNGFIYKDVYEGWYALRDEAFYNEDELVDGKAPTGAEVSWHKEESYFFKLSAFEDSLLALYEAVPDFVQPKSKLNEVVSFVKSGLKDLSISRTSFEWGVGVPKDENHIMYVWLDALTNYLSALNFSKDDDKLYQDFWLNAAESPIHIVGKDILRFHAIYWPAFLMAAKLPLPNRIFAHGWWTNEGQKISKSVGNVIDPYKEIEWLKSFDLEREVAIDYFRYFLMKEVPFGNDGDYSRSHLIERINAELANNIGNLAQRTLSMIAKNCDCEIRSINKDLEIDFEESIKQIQKYLQNCQFDRILTQIMELGSKANEFLHEQAPWNLKKEGKIKEMEQALYVSIEAIRKIAILLRAFIPVSSDKILDLLNISEKERSFDDLQSDLKQGHKINKPLVVFPKIKIDN